MAGSTRAGSATEASGTIPWHPHYAVTLASGLSGRVDLADGHFDLGLVGMQLAARGLLLTFAATWDSTLALAGTSSIAGQGVQSTVSPRMSGAPGSTVTYTADDGARWVFTYSGGSYQPIAGLPLSLSATGSGYTLTNTLTSATRQFDSQGRLTSEADAYGNADTLSYGSSGPTGLANSGGRVLTLVYNASNLLSDVKSPLWVSTSGAQGQHVALTYGGSGCGSTQLCTLTRGAGTSDAATTTLAYSGSLLHTVTTGSGHTWTLGWDASNRLVSVTSPISGTIGQAGYTPAYTTQISYGSGSTTVTQGYGTSGTLSTTYTLDGSGQPTAIADGLGHTSSLTYDAYHDVLTTRDPDTNLITNTYALVVGGVGLLTQTTRAAITPYGSSTPQQPSTSESYSATHDLTASVSASGAASDAAYDGHHGLTATAAVISTVTQGGTTTYYWRGQRLTRDAFGEVVSVTDGRGLTIGTTSSAATMPTLTPNGLANRYTSHDVYDAQGDLIASATAPITTTLNGVTGTHPVTTTYSYDADGDQTAVTTPNGETTSIAYDHLGRPVSTTLPQVWISPPLCQPPNPCDPVPEHPTLTAAYDGDGHVVRRTDPAGHVSSATYDPLGRLTGSTNALGATTILTYTATALVAARDPLGKVVASYAHDAAGRLTGTTDALGDTRSTGYDAAGRRRTTSLPTVGSTLAATVDAGGRVTALAEGGTQASYGYSADDQPTQAALPGGVSESSQYDVAGHLTLRTISGPGLSESYSYTYNPAGWMTSIVSTINGTGPLTTTLTHDAFGHLTAASSSSGSSSSWAYGYQDDSLSSAATSGTPTLYYTQNRGLLVSTSQTQGACLTPCTKYYEQRAGISKVDAFPGGGNNTETQDSYDGAGRLTRVVQCPAQYGGALCAGAATATATLAYNARGQRASYAITGSWGSISQHFWYRGGQLAQVATVAGTSAYTDTYLYDPSGAPYELARQQNGTTNRYWYETDGQGNVVALTDSHGNVVDSYQYDLWGNPTSVSESVPQRLRYRGYWDDAELGTYWLGVRQYDPSLKQFLQADPSQAEGLAAYAYAHSDPVDLADPSGNDACNPGTGTGGYACQCPSGMQVGTDASGSMCTCPYNEAEYYGQCGPVWTNNPLIYPDGECWPNPSDCAGDAAYQEGYNLIYATEYAPGSVGPDSPAVRALRSFLPTAVATASTDIGIGFCLDLANWLVEWGDTFSFAPGWLLQISNLHCDTNWPEDPHFNIKAFGPGGRLGNYHVFAEGSGEDAYIEMYNSVGGQRLQYYLETYVDVYGYDPTDLEGIAQAIAQDIGLDVGLDIGAFGEDMVLGTFVEEAAPLVLALLL